MVGLGRWGGGEGERRWLSGREPLIPEIGRCAQFLRFEDLETKWNYGFFGICLCV